MIPTSNYSARYGGRVRLVILHTTEGATDVDSLGHFFQTGTRNASYHGAFDDERYESYVNYSYASWATLSANGYSDSAALCCAAVRDGWSGADWERHPRMLDLAAAWVADRCIARGLPIRRLTVPEVRAARADPAHPGGVIMHHDWTAAVEGTHSDCGTTFPWDRVLTRARQIAGPVPAPARRSRRREDNEMQLPPTLVRIDQQIPTDVIGGWCGNANLLLTANTGGSVVHGVFAIADRGATPPLLTEILKSDAGQPFQQWWPLKHPLPPGTTSVVVNYTAPAGMVARVEYER